LEKGPLNGCCVGSYVYVTNKEDLITVVQLVYCLFSIFAVHSKQMLRKIHDFAAICIVCNSEEKFVKKTLKLDRVNSDPEYLRGKICKAFPELSSGGRDSGMFKLWQVRENRTELIPLPVDINNAQALFTYEELKRSCVYIKADVSIYTIHHII